MFVALCNAFVNQNMRLVAKVESDRDIMATKNVSRQKENMSLTNFLLVSTKLLGVAKG
jgi:hypothetical protein